MLIFWSVSNAFNYDFEENSYKFTDKQIKELKKALFNEQQGTANDYLHLVYAKGLKAEKPNKIYHNWKSKCSYLQRNFFLFQRK